MMKRLQDKIALVTGASRGIGYFTALALAREGAHVIALARTVGGLEELDDAIGEAGGTATLVPLDITDYDALDRLGASIDERWGRLDIFIANAGILGGLSPLGHFEPKTFERVLAANLTANWRLIRSLDPLLKASDAGRALLVSSGAAQSCKSFWGAYSVSKAGLEALGKTWAAESANSNLKVNLVNPGATATAMRAQAMPGENPETLPHAREVAETFVALVLAENTVNGGLFDHKNQSWV
ncbi:SDR family NAD(P)-dependent oxidoreductase [Salaquimonas pukyongi]|uniref:SDR family NAD(P)-dependent oxidoreductase n=1 Tax=Salaquimonas pukyongi TaxID=2712698 RepID=UPI0012EB70AC|nr:SDR family NAD(P)-dependent oxidoreductase [Salaquimonas pukyongi]